MNKGTIMLAVALFSAAMATAEEGTGSDTFKDCMERYGNTACKPMRDEGNMNNACAKAEADCWEQAESDEEEREDESE